MNAAPTFIPSMELLAVTRLPEGPEWTFEVKLNGYRAQVIHGARLRLLSRRGKDFSSQFRETHRALASAIPAGSTVDGELVALDAQGRPDCQSIQNSKTSGASVVFFAFDILIVAGREVRRRYTRREDRERTANGCSLKRKEEDQWSPPFQCRRFDFG
jgi:ATP-dependent DNA ligase